jgi:hypothetical protein
MAKFYRPYYSDIGGTPTRRPAAQPEQQPTQPGPSETQPAQERLPAVELGTEAGEAQEATDTNSLNIQ